MATYLRSIDTKAAQRAHRQLTAAANGGRGSRGRYAVGGAVLVVLIALGVAAFVLSASNASLSVDNAGLVKVGMPLGGGTITRVTVLDHPKDDLVPVTVKGDPTIWPTGKIPAHEQLTIEVTVKRPGWISWLTGQTQTMHMTMRTPSASLASHYLTLKNGAPVVLTFKSPVRTFAYGSPGHMVHRSFATPVKQVTIPRTANAGTTYVSATMRTWETAKNAQITWFPSGGAASAIASPAPGSKITPTTRISLTFSKPISQALGSHMPPVTPAGSGSWHQSGPRSIEFVPSGYGYGLGANVSVALPSGVRLVGGSSRGGATSGDWTVPPGSMLRLQQLLAQLGYLPLSFNGTKIANSAAAQVEAAVNPPKGSFNWRYPNIPGALRQMWAPGTYGTMTKGAIMAFENNNDLTTDGVPGATVWKTLINDADTGKGGSTFGYTFVQVSEGSPESEQTWHDGSVKVSGPVNTGVPAAPTAQGIFPVFEHAPSVTMTGVNPDGSHYSDPGILWVSYFNGGDALHEFPRASYGFPQSDGCVEMPLAEAAAVYPFTPIGTLVDVS